ncbi:hypothetical protein [Streptomyces ehimensis]|uniref:PepSY domain-containing protein n=1 Tax=Streptomyces ehimensis TaxID=68195 RepID=A0ABV9BSX9_9ACTN
MSEPIETGETLPQEEPKAAGAGRTRTGSGRAGRWVRCRSVRWVAAGAAVLVIGGGAAAAVAHHHHEGEEGHGHGHDRRTAAGDRGWHDGGDDREDRKDGGRADHPAPAPLPSTSAADALTKASSAVSGGKVESLKPVTEQGGGRAWRVVVLGADGVRHAVTIDGAGDTITGNTVLDG